MRPASQLPELGDIGAAFEGRADRVAQLCAHVRAGVADHGLHVIEAVNENAEQAVAPTQDQRTRLLIFALATLPDIDVLADATAEARLEALQQIAEIRVIQPEPNDQRA